MKIPIGIPTIYSIGPGDWRFNFTSACAISLVYFWSRLIESAIFSKLPINFNKFLTGMPVFILTLKVICNLLFNIYISLKERLI